LPKLQQIPIRLTVNEINFAKIQKNFKIRDMHLEGWPPAWGLDEAGVEDGEVDERVGRNEEVGEQGGHHVQVT
jgi:hypothetical protein